MAAQHRRAAGVGAAVLEAGGDAVDAAAMVAGSLLGAALLQGLGSHREAYYTLFALYAAAQARPVEIRLRGGDDPADELGGRERADLGHRGQYI